MLPSNLPLRRLASSLILVLLAGLAPAQVKAGKYYEDKTDLGFKVQAPADYEFVPSQPGDPNSLGKFAAPSGKGVLVQGGARDTWPLACWLVKFDKRPVPPSGDGSKPKQRPETDVVSWMRTDKYLRIGDWKKVGEKKLKAGKLEFTEVQYGAVEDGTELRVYVALYALQPEVELALIFNGPGDEKKWRKFESSYQQMAKSFKLVTVGASSEPELEADASLRDQKRSELQEAVKTQPGWKFYESPNYFFVSNSDDADFMKELIERLEAIRKVYEQTYPATQATALREKALTWASEHANQRPVTGSAPSAARIEDLDWPADSLERSRCSTVRVLTDQEMYLSYGAPERSAGYWSSFHGELVIFDDQKSGGRRDTWATLNHEAFHQYVYYFYGDLAPHSWYNEGTGDFYSGYQYGGGKKFTLKPFDWRTQQVRDMIREGDYVPWEEIVRWTQAEYYGSNKYGRHGSDNYAQGWGMIYFLRTGSGKAPGWKKEWDQILPVYLDTLAITRDLKQAVDKAFEGVDWDALETSWKAYMDKAI